MPPNQTTAGPLRPIRRCPSKGAVAAACALRAAAPHPPNTEGIDLNDLHHLTRPCTAASLPQALLAITWRVSQKALENDTPDATGGCAAWRPQSQCWCGFAPTTPHREADHGQTTALASH